MVPAGHVGRQISPARDLTTIGSVDKPNAMHLARTVLTVFVALAVAMVPVSAGMAVAKSHDVSMGAHEADCCPHKKPCEKKADDCDSIACVFKRLGSSAFLATGIVLKSVPPAKPTQALAYAALNSNPTAPPLPPPRV
jgi:hypothetical protein